MSKLKFLSVALASAVLLTGFTGTAFADGDAAKGKKLWKKCKACHTTKDGGKNKIGPNLYGIFGKAAGTHEGYKYSAALKDSGITWDDATMDTWLTKPKKMVPKTKMVFPGFKKESQRQDMIAYLKEATK
ncbi:MAG: cytochrome c family protein [Rhodospirillaceae bacterium]|mgnify:CR=1 FL=1|jgi:cytochrome c|nr:cytochrome c family protein [Rhodospirillaceae bacterium]MBT5373277.1 cytochrome c family protein [Rhodospirillaceae bacterium]MBT5659203.1 cytochrome c family protein [Rhodospirillaceae bacterium]MBT5751428.1 cytochrome c family protein [Rhodospirillaceae bacterium]